MEEELIDFELAELAKQKGFDRPTLYHYYKDDKGEVSLDNGDGDNEFIYLNSNAYDNLYSAPTLYGLQQWLIEKKILMFIVCHTMMELKINGLITLLLIYLQLKENINKY